jgi:hypothetical protein
MIKKYLWPVLVLACLGAGIILVSRIDIKPAYGDSGSIVSSFFMPPSYEYAISQGLAYDGTYLLYLDDYWYPDGEEYATIYKVTTTGSIVGSYVAPDTSTNDQKGLAWDGNDIWVSIPGQRKIYKLGGQGAPLSTDNWFSYDITYDSGYIYEVDGESGWVYKINTGTGSTVSSFAGPDPEDEKCFGLTNDGTYLYIGTYGRNPKIYKYTLAGSAVTSYSAPCGHPLGLTYDGTYLWCVDDETEHFYKFEK